MIEKEDFIRTYCRRADMTREEFDMFLHAVPCDCGYSLCEGWAAVPLSLDTYNGLPLRGQ